MQSRITLGASALFFLFSAVTAHPQTQSQLDDLARFEQIAKETGDAELMKQAAELRALYSSSEYKNIGVRSKELDEMSGDVGALTNCLTKVADVRYDSYGKFKKGGGGVLSSKDCDIVRKRSTWFTPNTVTAINRYEAKKADFITASDERTPGGDVWNQGDRREYRSMRSDLKVIDKESEGLAVAKQQELNAERLKLEELKRKSADLMTSLDSRQKTLVAQKSAELNRAYPKNEANNKKNKTTVELEKDIQLLKTSKDPAVVKQVETLEKTIVTQKKIEAVEDALGNSKDLFRDVDELKKEVEASGKDWETFKKDLKNATKNSLLELTIEETINERLPALVDQRVAERLKALQSDQNFCESVNACISQNPIPGAAADRLQKQTTTTIVTKPSGLAKDRKVNATSKK